MGELFQFSGRASRSTWWGVTLMLAAINILLYLVLLPQNVITFLWTAEMDIRWYYDLRRPFDSNDQLMEFWWNYGAVVYLLCALVLVPISLAVSVRRWHDLGTIGWFVLINLIPYLGWFVSFIALGFISGNAGANKYGPPPVSTGSSAAYPDWNPAAEMAASVGPQSNLQAITRNPRTVGKSATSTPIEIDADEFAWTSQDASHSPASQSWSSQRLSPQRAAEIERKTVV